MSANIWFIEDVEISVNVNGQFCWADGDGDRMRQHDTLEAAQSAVKSYLHDKARAGVLKFDPIPVVCAVSRGTNIAAMRTRLMKFHASTLDPILADKLIRPTEDRSLLFDDPGVFERFSSLLIAEANVRAAKKSLEDFRVPIPHVYRRVSPDEYTAKMDRFLASIAARKAVKA